LPLPYIVVVNLALLLLVVAHLVLLLLTLGCYYSPCVVIVLLFIHVLISPFLVLLLFVEVLYSPPLAMCSLEHLEIELKEPKLKKRKKDAFKKNKLFQ
jgi:hypothetical protein